MPQTSSSPGPPHLRPQARMQASTASACLRKLSDCVNSVSRSHAASRVPISDMSPKISHLIRLFRIGLPDRHIRIVGRLWFSHRIRRRICGATKFIREHGSDLNLLLKIWISWEPSRLSCAPQKDQWRSLVCGSSPCHLCRPCPSEDCPSSCAALRSRPFSPLLCHTCVGSIFSSALNLPCE